MGLTVECLGTGMSSIKRGRLRKAVHDQLENGALNIGRSASGLSVAYAVEWFEKNKKPYQIKAYPGIGYFIESISEITGD